jgi:hypothetical protein
MGIDLIGFIAKGPLDLSGKKEIAIKFLEQRNVFLKESIAKIQSVLNDDVNLDDDVNYAKLFNNDKLLNNFLEENRESYYDIPELIEDKLIIDNPKKLVEEFIDFWANGYARDATSRLDPDDPTKIIMFAGSESYGDEPNGYGYNMLKKAFQVGLRDIFNIK